MTVLKDMTKAKSAIGRKVTSLTQGLSTHSIMSGNLMPAKHTIRRQIGNESGKLGTNLNVTSFYIQRDLKLFIGSLFWQTIVHLDFSTVDTKHSTSRYSPDDTYVHTRAEEARACALGM